MQDLVRRYLDSGLSRRGFLENMAGLGFSLAAARAVLKSADAAETAAGRLDTPAGVNDNELWNADVILGPSPGYDQKEIPRQFTKICWEARRAESLAMMLRRAFKVASTDPGGPVYLAMAHYALETKGTKAQIL